MKSHGRLQRITGAGSLFVTVALHGTLALTALAAAACSGGTAAKESPGAGGTAAKPASVSVVCDDDYPPFAFRDSEGRLQGIVVDQWKVWERETGVRAELRGLPWAAALAVFEAGGADVLDTVFETPQRLQRYDFTGPYARIDVPVFIHKTLSGIASAADLHGFKVGVKDGDAAIGELVQRGVGELSLYQSYEEIVDAAVRLDLRAFCVDGPPALYFLYKRGVDRDFRIAFTLNEGAFHRAVLKGRPEIFKLVESGFAAIGRGDISAINRKWFGSAIERKFDPRITAMVGSAALGLILLLVAVSWTLKRKVAAATAALHDKVLLLESSEKLLRSSLAEKNILLKEIHHRVKNNLQVISSLIQLQSYALHDERDLELLQETQQRIRAMAQLHELLYRSRDLGSIDAAEYLGSLAHELALSSGRTEPELRAESCRLALDEAVPLGLIANELVQNALKHAYPKGQDGHISIEFFRDGKEYVLVVSDRGTGLPAGFDPLAARSMGLTLVRSLSEQLGGILAFDGPPGFSARLRFPSRTAT